MAAIGAQRRCFRKRKDCLVEYSDAELVERYRFDSAGIRFLEGLIGNELMSGSRRNCAISPLQNILSTLRFLATGKMQLCNGDDMGVSQPTVFRAITATLRCVSSPQICAQFIKFPLNLQEIRKNQEGFFKIAGFPGIVGPSMAHMFKSSLLLNTKTNMSTDIITTTSTHRLSLIHSTR